MVRKNKGITLVTLVITIIVLLILAGVSLTLILGNEGILGRATSAVDKTEQAKVKEEIEMGILDIQMEKIAQGESVTLETLANFQLEAKFEEITAELDQNEIIGEYKDYEYEIDQNLKVTIGNKLNGLKVRYSLSPEGYTNQDVLLQINATSTNGDVKIEVPNDIIANEDGTYRITKNGSYQITVTDSQGGKKTKTIEVETIDKVEPLNFSITKVEEAGKTKIIAKTEDGEATQENVKSGIEKYEYNINGKKYETTEESYTIDTPAEEGGHYTIYVNAYDKAGNLKKSENIFEFGTLLFISENGNDNDGNGSKTTPYKSINKAIEKAENKSTIHIGEGNYELTAMEVDFVNDSGNYKPFGKAGIYDQNKELLIYGENEKTVLTFDGSKSNVRDGPAVILWNSNTVLRNLTYVFKPKSPTNYNSAIFTCCNGTIENVFFRTIGGNKASYLYHNGQDIGKYPANNVRNCTFFHDLGAVNSNYTGKCNFTNIATNVETNGTNTNVVTKNFGTASTSLQNLIQASKNNADFNTKRAGVYYGTHAWNK